MQPEPEVIDQQARIEELETALRCLFEWADEYIEVARSWPSVRRAGLALGMDRWW